MPTNATKPRHDDAADTRALMMREIRLVSTMRTVHDALATLAASIDPAHRAAIQRLTRDIEHALQEDDTWREFVHRFDTVHGNYLSDLAREFPTLTPTELRLCAFLRLPMPSKEVAALFHCSVRSIEKHRERLRKKFGLRPHENLTTFLAARGGSMPEQSHHGAAA